MATRFEVKVRGYPAETRTYTIDATCSHVAQAAALRRAGEDGLDLPDVVSARPVKSLTDPGVVHGVSKGARHRSHY